MYFLSTSSPPQFPCIINSRSSPPSNHTHHHIRHHNFLHQIPQPSHQRNHPDHHNYTVSPLRVLVFWIIYRATDMTIIIAHKPINRSDTIGVMWNHIICTAAVPYNKKVTIFPCQSAPCTFPVFCITRHPLTTIYSSLPAIITIKRSMRKTSKQTD